MPLPEGGESFTVQYLGMSSSDFRFKGNKGYVFLNLKMRLKLLRFYRSVFDLCLLPSLPNRYRLSVHSSMSEGESQTVVSSGSDPKVESSSSAPGLTSVSPPVTSTTSAASPEEEEESEDESEILEESPCGRWQKRREEVR